MSSYEATNYHPVSEAPGDLNILLAPVPDFQARVRLLRNFGPFPSLGKLLTFLSCLEIEMYLDQHDLESAQDRMEQGRH